MGETSFYTLQKISRAAPLRREGIWLFPWMERILKPGNDLLRRELQVVHDPPPISSAKRDQSYVKI